MFRKRKDEVRKAQEKRKKARDRRAESGDMELSRYYQRKFSRMYDGAIETAYEETPVPEPGPGKKKGRKKRGKVLALVDRLKEHKAAVCLFYKGLCSAVRQQPGRNATCA